MAARAIWKGVIRFGDIAVPVKLYSAMEDRSVHFRLLHRKDKSPVKQAMVNPETDEVVPYQETLRAYRTEAGDLVVLSQDELNDLIPAKNRDIRILHFLSKQVIGHRWYQRPYYLGPDGARDDYFALADALQASDREGLARWVMRNKEYLGVLRLFQGYPMLVTLRYAEQVLSAQDLEPPRGKPLDKKELSMARRLIGMLEAEFEPTEYQDEYRDRVLQLIARKQKGGRVKKAPRREARASGDLTRALEESLRSARNG